MYSAIEDIVQQIVSRFHPYRIILFGSHAYGTPTSTSDVDLLVVMIFRGGARRQAAIILQSIDYHIPLDLIVHSPDSLQERIKAGDFFLREIVEKGKVLYEQPLSRMGGKS